MLRAIARNGNSIRRSLKNATKVNSTRSFSHQCVQNITAHR